MNMNSSVNHSTEIVNSDITICPEKMNGIENNNNCTVCLNMIVKNESNIITRLFDSVLPIIDCFCICDTGSTDNTANSIKSYFENKGIPGKIVFEPFKDFEYSRNYALKHCVGMSEYILFLDADMILQINPCFDKNILRTNRYHYILQGNNDYYYKNMRIIKNDGLSYYKGVTHEYIYFSSDKMPYDISKSELFILDVGDGGSKANKYERDVDLLTKGLELEPMNDRYYFYLANSYFDLGKFDEAIRSYINRINFGGWEQEVWFSYYKIGLAFQAKNMIEHAISWWLDGYNFFPRRIENLYKIVEHYRIVRKHKTAHVFYKMAKEVLDNLKPGEKDHYLFLHNDIYVYKLEYELSILSSYLGITNINTSAMCIFNNSTNTNIIKTTLSNLKFYKQIVKPLKVVDFTNSISRTIANKNRGFNSSSASLIKNDNGYLMNIRYVNYVYDNEGVKHNCEDHVISLNKRIELTSDFSIITEKITGAFFPQDKRYIGIEDVRLFNNPCKTGKILYVGTGIHVNGEYGLHYGNYDDLCNSIGPIELKSFFNKSICDTCCSLYSCDNSIVDVDVEVTVNIVYKWSPLQLCTLDIRENIGIVYLKEEKPMPKIFNHVKGATNGCFFNGENWFVVYMISYETPCHYYHMIVVFDKNMQLSRYSYPIQFEGGCIECCLGIVVENHRIIMSYSTWDRNTKLGIYDKKYIESILYSW